MKKLILLSIVIVGFTSLVSAQWQPISPPAFNHYYSWLYSHTEVASHNWIYWAYCWTEYSFPLSSSIEMFSSSDNGDSWDSLHYWTNPNLLINKIEFISEDTGYFIYYSPDTKSVLFQTMNNFNPFNYSPIYCQEIFTYRHSVMLNYNDLYIIDSKARIFHLENDTIQLIYDLPIVLNQLDKYPTIFWVLRRHKPFLINLFPGYRLYFGREPCNE